MHTMVKVMKAFVRIVVDQDEQLHSTVRVRAKRSSDSCVRQSVPHSNIILKKSVVNVNTSSFSYFPTNVFNAEHVI